MFWEIDVECGGKTPLCFPSGHDARRTGRQVSPQITQIGIDEVFTKGTESKWLHPVGGVNMSDEFS